MTLGLAGASGALGGEIVAALGDAPWKPARLVPFARASSTTSFVRLGEEEIAVDDLAHADLADLDVLIVATPADVARPLIAAALDAGVSVVDCTSTHVADLQVPLVVPWLDPTALDAPRSRDVLAIPSAPGLVVGSVLAALAREGLAGRGGGRGRARATVMLPASSFGRDAIEELSQQVVAMFNSNVPPRKIFPQGLAFDVEPVVGAEAPSGWTDVELRAATEIARLSGWMCDVDVVGVPVFSGLGVTLQVEAGEDWDAERLASALAVQGLEVRAGARRVPRPRRMAGSVLPSVGRVRVAPSGSGLHLWLSADNLRVVASAAVAAAGHLAVQRAGDAAS